MASSTVAELARDRGAARELGMRAAGLGEPGFDPGDPLLGSLGRPDRPADDPRLLLPRDAVVGVPLGLGGRLEVDLILAHDHRLGITDRVLDPGPGGERLVAVPLPHPHGHDAQREQEVVTTGGHRRYPGRLGGTFVVP